MKIVKRAYHRNGVSGTPFHVYITESDGTGPTPKRALVIQFDSDDPNYPQCAAFDLDLLKNDVIEFGENSWRGDRVAAELATALEREGASHD